MGVLFIVQSFVSSAPAILLLVALPVILADSIKISIFSTIGVAFFLVRLSSLIGALVAPKLERQFSPQSLSSFSELSCGIVLLGAGFYYHNTAILVSALIVRFLFVGILAVIRMAWLKKLILQKNWNDRIIFFVSAAPQVSYIFTGIYLIYSPLESLNFQLLIWIDSATSFLGAGLFLLLPNAEPTENREEKSLNKLSLNFDQMMLLSAVTLAALAMGGTNYLLWDYGLLYFKSAGGYGMAVLLYSIFFMLALGVLTKTTDKYGVNSKYLSLSSLLLLTSLVSLGQFSMSMNIIIFATLFFSYAVLLIAYDYLWVKITSESQISRVFSIQFILSSIIWACGELFYSSFPSMERPSRIFFVFLLTACLFYWINQSRKQTNRPWTH